MRLAGSVLVALALHALAGLLLVRLAQAVPSTRRPEATPVRITWVPPHRPAVDDEDRRVRLPARPAPVEDERRRPPPRPAPPRPPVDDVDDHDDDLDDLADDHDVEGASPRPAAPDPGAPVDEAGPAAPPTTPTTPTAPAAPSTTAGDPAPPIPLGPRAPAERSFLDRVVVGYGPGPRASARALAEAAGGDLDGGDAPSDAERARRVAEATATVKALPRETARRKPDLRPTDDGGYAYETGGFRARIRPTGEVDFEAKYTDAQLGSKGPVGEGFLRQHDEARAMGNARVDPMPGLVSGSFDPTAALLVALGEDPYAAEKICFLEDTRALRDELATAHRRTQGLVGVRRAAEAAWLHDVDRPAVERRAALFEVWDECLEEELGREARALVESFIRQHLPRGSPDAYTDEELVALNARRTSKDAFSPYGG